MATSEHRVPRKRLSDRVADQLEALIVAGEFPVGSKLPAEPELAQRFEVGRSSMREAVRTLAAAGYLRSTHGSGVYVTSDRSSRIGPLDLTLAGGYTMSDLFEVRIAIESTTAELAARRLTDHHLELLQSILTAAGDAEATQEEFVRLDGRFHRQVAEASGNPLLLLVWDSFAAQHEEYSLKVIGMPGRQEHAHADHVAIAEAIAERDPERAGRLAGDHVRTVQAELKSQPARPVDVRQPRSAG